MGLDEFSKICKRQLDAYLKKVECEIKCGNIKYAGKKINRAYYPTTLLCVESDDNVLSFELLGLSHVRKSLKIKKKRQCPIISPYTNGKR
ncbi:hypothetical protein [Klebsiella grimontii]|uniref:hypothetical protein n=1 Tax=Klebsiella grimontii TaxID=2058152 RepID=UPI0011E682C9|nr:hypothetical protein [Klebsiella grimontii]